MNYAIYTVDGKIQKILSCPATSLQDNLSPGEASIEIFGGEADWSHYVNNGVVVAMPVRPDIHQVFDYATKSWIDLRTLQDFKDAAWTRIKTSRESAIDSNLVTPYGTFDCKAKDRTNMTDAVLMLQTLNAIGQPTTIDFTLADNSTVVLTTTEMVTVALLLGQKVQAAHSQARALRAQIDAANSSTELEAIVWV